MIAFLEICRAGGRGWMLQLSCILLAAMLHICPSDAASFVVETGNIRILKPDSATKAVYDSAIGDFGIPLYGASMRGSVRYLPDDTQGCSEVIQPLPGMSDILLVDRGGCFFVEKAWHAQQAGALALIVADTVRENLVTMAVPENQPELAALVDKITIPTALISKDAGDDLKSLLNSDVEVEMDWSEAIAHPDARDEWELWFTTNSACGPTCSAQSQFIRSFKDTAKTLEQQNSTKFTPHVLVGTCRGGKDCSKECIHGGRYCAVESLPSTSAYNGASVMEENLRTLCVFKIADEMGKPWIWWDYASEFAERCTMESNNYNKDCAIDIMRQVGIDTAAVSSCAVLNDAPNEMLEAQLIAQTDTEGTGRGRVVLLPTVVINNDQYRGRLDAPSVLRALCSGFSETTEPSICTTGALEVNECENSKDDCWHGDREGLTACLDTFRGYICRCPTGYQGDGHQCEDIDECALGISGCDQKCVNDPPGSYHCECNVGYSLFGGKGSPGMCVPYDFTNPGTLPAWLLVLLFGAFAVVLSLGGVGLYKWRLRREMQDEIRSIMRQYMPLDDDTDKELGESLLVQNPSKGGRGLRTERKDSAASYGF